MGVAGETHTPVETVEMVEVSAVGVAEETHTPVETVEMVEVSLRLREVPCLSSLAESELAGLRKAVAALVPRFATALQMGRACSHAMPGNHGNRHGVASCRLGASMAAMKYHGLPRNGIGLPLIAQMCHL